MKLFLFSKQVYKHAQQLKAMNTYPLLNQALRHEDVWNGSIASCILVPGTRIEVSGQLHAQAL
jgi:hypothetical protein